MNELKCAHLRYAPSSLPTNSREIKTSSSLIYGIAVCLFWQTKSSSVLRHGQFPQWALGNYKEHWGVNDRNFKVSNGAGSQTVKKLFLQLTHPTPIFHLQRSRLSQAWISPLFVVDVTKKVIVFCELKQKASYSLEQKPGRILYLWIMYISWYYISSWGKNGSISQLFLSINPLHALCKLSSATVFYCWRKSDDRKSTVQDFRFRAVRRISVFPQSY